MKKEGVDITNRNLLWLCSEHYNSLMIVCTIRRAIRHSVSNLTIHTYIQQEFLSHLEQHFKEEELWLFPKLPTSNALRRQAEKQHDQLRKMVNDFEIEPCYFADLLEEHIRF
jgi:hemerythrin